MTPRTGDDQPQLVLVIDDAQDIHDLVEVRLRSEGIRIAHAHDAEQGLAMARELAPDLVLLDLDLPGRSGLEVCHDLLADPALAAIPVIFLTGTVDVDIKVEAFEAGAVDYVTKPFDAIELRARARAALRTKRYQDLLATRGQLDGVTGLWNRAYFDEHLATDVAAAARYQRGLALLLLDIDHFKTLNDSCGHPFGDLALRRIAETIKVNLRPGDVACRYGGDEFAVILREADAHAAGQIAARIRDAATALELVHDGARVPITTSIGYYATELTSQPVTPADLLAAADRGLYAAKRAGRDCIAVGT